MDSNEANANLPKVNQAGSPESFQEFAINNVQQNQEKQGPASAEVAPVAPTSALTSAALPSVQRPAPAPVADPATDNAATTDTPLVAADDEVIEQEWVQKAKQIVLRTKEDPYSQEKEIGRLQADYIKKRYGKEIKLIEDE
jgi:hypothetical protein